jgi:hypothetical protein
MLVIATGMRTLWIVTCLMMTATAHAQPSSAAPGAAPPAPLPEPAAALDDYRWQVLAADAVVGSAVLVAAHSESGTGVVIAGVAYVLTAPLIHIAHDRGGRAFGSLAMRVALPLFGALVGTALVDMGARKCAPPASEDLCDGDGDDEVAVGALLGFGVGALSAMIIDAAFVARPVPRERPTWAPQVGVTRDRVSLGIAGRF